MPYTCSVCADKLETAKAWPVVDRTTPRPVTNADLFSTHCGHIYHAYCLFKWIATRAGQQISVSCPNCRKLVDPSQCRPVYPDLEAGYTQGQETSEDSADLENVVSTLRTDLASQITRNRAQGGELDEKTKLYELLSDDYDQLNVLLATERKKNDVLSMQLNSAKSYKSVYQTEQQKSSQLKEELVKFNYIRSMLEEIKEETALELHDRKGKAISSALESLVQVNILLKKEVVTNKANLVSSKVQVKTALQHVSTHKKSIMAKNKEIEELGSVIADLQGKLTALSSSAKEKGVTQELVTQLSGLPGKSQQLTQNNLKRKPSAFAKLDKRMIANSDNEEETQPTTKQAKGGKSVPQAEVVGRKGVKDDLGDDVIFVEQKIKDDSQWTFPIKSNIPGLSPICNIRLPSSSRLAQKAKKK